MLPTLERNAPALILNVGSIASAGVPLASVYAGSKAFNMAFSNSLRLEMRFKSQDVEVLGIMAAEATSGANKNAPNLFILTSRQMARAALNRVGCGCDVLYAAFPHMIQGWLLQSLPKTLLDMIIVIISRDRLEKEKKWS